MAKVEIVDVKLELDQRHLNLIFRIGHWAEMVVERECIFSRLKSLGTQ